MLSPSGVQVSTRKLKCVLVVISNVSCFGLALDRRCCRVFELQPSPRAAGDVGRSKALAHDPLVTKLAGVAENNVAWLLDVFAKLQPGRGCIAGSSRKQVASSLRRPSSVPVDDAAFAGY